MYIISTCIQSASQTDLGSALVVVDMAWLLVTGVDLNVFVSSGRFLGGGENHVPRPFTLSKPIIVCRLGGHDLGVDT